MKTILKKLLYGFVIIYTLVGFFLVPYLIKTKVVEVVNKQINGKLTVESARFNPYNFNLTIYGLKLVSAEDKTLFSLEKFSTNFELYSLFLGNIHFRDIELKAPQVNIVYSADKKLNLLNIAKPSEVKTQSADSSFTLPRILLDKIAIVDGSVSYEDYTGSTPYKLSVNDLGFNVKGIDTGDESSTNKKKSTSVFRAVLNDGGYLKLTNTIKSFSPFVVEGNVEFKSSQLYTQWKYLKDKLHIEIADGKVSISSNYYVDLSDLANLKIYDAAINISKLRVKPKDENFDVLNVNSLKVEDISATPLKQKAHISNITLSGLDAKIQRTGEAKIDWQDYFKYNNDSNKTTVKKEEANNSKPFDLTIDDIDVKDIKVTLQDRYISPNVTTTLNNVYLHVKNATTLGTTPLKYNLITQINNGFDCMAEGSLITNDLDLYTSITCSGLDLVKFRPYIDDVAKNSLKKYDLQLDSAIIGFDSKLSIKDENSSINIKVTDGNFALNALDISKKSTSERLFSLNEFNIKDILAVTANERVDIGSSAIISPKIYMTRYKNGVINFNDIIVAKSSTPSSKQTKQAKSASSKDWRVLLSKFDIKDANIRFKDNVLSSSALTSVDKINLHVSNIDSMKRSWLNYDLRAKINNSGNIRATGKLRHTPLKQNGSFSIEKLPLKFLNPYINEYSYMNIDDGYFNFKAKESYSPSKRSPDLSLNGALSINGFFVNDTRDNSSLISFNKLSIPSYDFEYAPNRLYVDKAVLDSFYVNAVIDENKTINFAKISKIESNDENKTVKSESNPTKEDSFPVRVMEIVVKNGSAKFADLSLPLRFQTNIHDLNGEIYGISSQAIETSYINLDGIVDEYGSAKINGSINSANPKLFTDMSVVFRNLDLSNLSPYSANFAGYKIDDGKLFLDLGYKIDNSKLDASNSVVIKKIKLGDTIDDENITVLPLGFVIGLLEDNDGIIDINLPIKGNMDEPDFKYGALVWKTIGGLITKAVTSPFALLGSVLGIDTEGLEAIDFEPGKTVLLPPEREKLDNLASALGKRQKLNLIVTGTYDKTVDKKSLQTAKLVDLVVEKSGITNEDEKKNALTIYMLEDIYEDYTKDDKLSEIKDKLREEYPDKEQFKQKYLSRLIDEDSQFMTVSDDELKNLANSRAKMISDYLTINHQVDSKRIELHEIQEAKIEDRWVKTKLDINVK